MKRKALIAIASLLATSLLAQDLIILKPDGPKQGDVQAAGAAPYYVAVVVVGSLCYMGYRASTRKLRRTKRCPECMRLIHVDTTVCPCGYNFIAHTPSTNLTTRVEAEYYVAMLGEGPNVNFPSQSWHTFAIVHDSEQNPLDGIEITHADKLPDDGKWYLIGEYDHATFALNCATIQ